MYVTVQCWLMKSKRIGKLALLETICEANGTSNHNPIKFPLLQQSHAQVSISSNVSQTRMVLPWKSFEIQQPFWHWVKSFHLRNFVLVFTAFSSHFWYVVWMMMMMRMEVWKCGQKRWKPHSTQTHASMYATLRYGTVRTRQTIFIYLDLCKKHNIHIKSMSWLKIKCDIFWFRLDWLHLMEFYSFQWLDLQNTTVFCCPAHAQNLDIVRCTSELGKLSLKCLIVLLFLSHIVLYKGMVVRCSSRFKLF